jgi:hypothetical protein
VRHIFWKFIPAALFFFSVSILSYPAMADSWPPPRQETVYSPDGNTRLVITPRDFDDALSYYEDKVANKDNPGLPEKSRRKEPFAIIETKGKDGIWSLQWQAPLANEISPASAAISNDGKHFVTFDNWGSIGYGDDVIAVYSKEKQLLRTYSLEELLPDFYSRAFYTTISSRYWRQDDVAIDDEGFNLNITIPERGTELFQYDKSITFRFRWRQEQYTIADPVKWVEAQISALGVAQDELAYEKKRLKTLITPLTWRENMTEREWQSYIQNAFRRLGPIGTNAATKFLRAKSHPEYWRSEKWIKDEFLDFVRFADLADSGNYQYLIIGTNEPDNLIDVFKDISSKASPSDFRAGRAYLVLAKSYWPQVNKIFAHTGLQITFIDPDQPIDMPEEVLDSMFNYRPENDPFADLFDALEEIENVEAKNLEMP